MLSKGFGPLALLKQRVRTFGAPSVILSEGFALGTLQPAILGKGFALLALLWDEGRK